MTQPDNSIPPPPPSVPATPIARELELVCERVFARVIERVEASNAEVKDALKHMLQEMFEMRREIEQLKTRVTAHDIQFAHLSAAVLGNGTQSKAKKRRRRAAKRR